MDRETHRMNNLLAAIASELAPTPTSVDDSIKVLERIEHMSDTQLDALLTKVAKKNPLLVNEMLLLAIKRQAAGA